MQSPELIVACAIVWFIPIFLYLLIGAFAKGRTASGGTTSKSMIFYPNFWYAIIVWGLFQLGLFMVMLTFPIWLKMI